jgi:hypothetical protein
MIKKARNKRKKKKTILTATISEVSISDAAKSNKIIMSIYMHRKIHMNETYKERKLKSMLPI